MPFRTFNPGPNTIFGGYVAGISGATDWRAYGFVVSSGTGSLTTQIRLNALATAEAFATANLTTGVGGGDQGLSFNEPGNSMYVPLIGL